MPNLYRYIIYWGISKLFALSSLERTLNLPIYWKVFTDDFYIISGQAAERSSRQAGGGYNALLRKYPENFHIKYLENFCKSSVTTEVTEFYIIYSRSLVICRPQKVWNGRLPSFSASSTNQISVFWYNPVIQAGMEYSWVKASLNPPRLRSKWDKWAERLNYWRL